ncbi:MAG TPA: MnhB domain-containing protein [Candidatus Nanoarchaeia archaeon]|nr:MnhB domain-containing protein [Candidatus Nanoarchaeia archaeon]
MAHLVWKFPTRKFLFMRIETVLIIVLALIIFFATLVQSGGKWLAALIYAVAFLVLYLCFSYFIQRYRQVEEKYHLTPTHLEITKKSKNNQEKAKVHLKDIKHHKLDKFFLGGYLLTHAGKKHLLFFNTKKEVVRFENFLKKHLKPISGKKKR